MDCEPFRTIVPVIEHKASDRIYCRICMKPTRLNKPWCPDHITESPYVKWIREQVARQERELDIVKRRKSSIFIEDDSLTLHEILSALHYKGAKTIKGLSKELSLDPETTRYYIDHLKALDMVRVELTSRNDDKTVYLLNDDPKIRNPPKLLAEKHFQQTSHTVSV